MPNTLSEADETPPRGKGRIFGNDAMFHRPFKCLRQRLNPRDLPKKKETVQSAHLCDSPPIDLEKEDRLFIDAVSDITPLFRNTRADNFKIDSPCEGPRQRQEDMYFKLAELIQDGKGFIVSQTPEYMEGDRASVHPDILRKLHDGEFSIQGHVDLHGLNTHDAKNTFDAFMTQSIETGKRAVLVVHGRGLRSPDKPVLKQKVFQWLSAGRWRKWVIAFTSARLCDGGAGATYVLLRYRPAPKRRFKNKTG